MTQTTTATMTQTTAETLKRINRRYEARRAETLSKTKEGRALLAAEAAKKLRAFEQERWALRTQNGGDSEKMAARANRRARKAEEAEKLRQLAALKKAEQESQGRFAGEKKSSKSK